jgi:5-methyltetrahydrofolate--homocysteine methyltransferase
MGYYCERDDVRSELREGRFERLMDLVRDGVEAGLQVVNVQLMEPSLDEAALVPEVVGLLHETFGCAVAVDSRDPAVVDEALSTYPHKALCNCVTGQREVLEAMLPVIAAHGAAVGTALVYENGVPETVEERVFVARRIVEAAEAHSIPREDVIIDAVCLPSAVHPDSTRITLRTLDTLHRELGVPTLLGISNAGFLMPDSRSIDLAYFLAAVSWGLDVAMIDPNTPVLAREHRAIDFLMGKDPYAKSFLAQYRAQTAEESTCGASSKRLPGSARR